jgi:hypothetical protein
LEHPRYDLTPEQVEALPPEVLIPTGSRMVVSSQAEAVEWALRFIERDPAREAEIIRSRGIYRVVQGYPGGGIRPENLAPALNVEPHEIETVAHTHPRYDEVRLGRRVAEQLQQVPSREDYGILIRQAMRLGVRAESRIYYRLRDGRLGWTEYAAEPSEGPRRLTYRIGVGTYAGSVGEFAETYFYENFLDDLRAGRLVTPSRRAR